MTMAKRAKRKHQRPEITVRLARGRPRLRQFDPMLRRRRGTWEASTKHLLGELVYRGLAVAGHAAVKIASIALAGGLANLIVHKLTDNHWLNATAMVVATGAAAAVNTRK